MRLVVVAMALVGRGRALEKSVLLVRHGVSEMNVALARRPWGSPGFSDPDIVDAPLTADGVAGAAALRGTLGDVDLVVASPLTRALQTATAAFDVAETPAVALPLAAERCYLSSDVGTPRSELAARWPRFDFADDRERWWYDEPRDDATDWRPPGAYAYAGEPDAAFRARMRRLVAWLDARDEAAIAVVAHWGVFDALTGTSFANCEARRVPLATLRASRS